MLRIGIVNQNQFPLTDISCFDFRKSSATYLRRTCKRPGFAVEIILLIAEVLMGNPKVEFIAAQGWSPMPSREGLIDLVRAGKVDFTIPQLALTHERSTLVRFTQPLQYQPGYCFLTCGEEHFFFISAWGVLGKLIGPKCTLLIGTVLMFLALICARSLQDRNHEFWTKLCNSTLNTILSRPKERSLIGKFHARFVSSLVILVLLRGVFKSGLIKQFSPMRRYPFENLRGLAKGLKEDGWTLVVNPASAIYHAIHTDLVFSPILQALERGSDGSYRNLGFPVESEQVQRLKDSRYILYGDLNNLFNLLSKYQELNCMCEPLEAKMQTMDAGIAMKRANNSFYELVNSGVVRLLEAGIVAKLAQKYKLPTQPITDSERFRNQGIKLKPQPRDLVLHIFSMLLLTYFICLCLAFFVFLAERMLQNEERIH